MLVSCRRGWSRKERSRSAWRWGVRQGQARVKACLLDVRSGKVPGPRGFLYLLLLVLLGCSGEPRLQAAPTSLGGLELHHEVTGARALGAIQRLHGEAEIELTDAWIAHYGEAVSAMLYIGVSRNRAEAETILAAMRDGIADGDTPFRGVHDTRLFGTDVYLMTGQGQLHFLYRDGKQVVWLSADPPVACATLAEVLAAQEEKEEACGPWGRDPAAP